MDPHSSSFTQLDPADLDLALREWEEEPIWQCLPSLCHQVETVAHIDVLISDILIQRYKTDISVFRLCGAAKSEDVGSEGGRGAAEQDGQPGEDDHRGGEAERQRQRVQRDRKRQGGQEIHQVSVSIVQIYAYKMITNM